MTLSRRETLRLFASGAAIAAVAACTRRPSGEVRPWVRQPEDAIPGVPTFYATSRVEDGLAIGLLAESHEGRPTKIEGNPRHPASLGGTGPRDQAWVLSLYDPTRGGVPRYDGQPASWDTIAASLAGAAGVHVLMPPTSSPTAKRLLEAVPDVRVHFWGGFGRGPAWEGARIAYGRPLSVRPDLSEARSVLAIGSDFLAEGPWALAHARAFAEARPRIAVVETAVTPTGSRADRRLAARPGELPAIFAAFARERLGEEIPAWPVTPEQARFVADLADVDAVVVGAGCPAWMHAVAARIGSPIVHEEPLLGAGEHGPDALLAALDAGEVGTLVLIGGNPVHGAPADLDLPTRLRRARRIVAFGEWEDETAALAETWAPLAHGLESWGDARAADGTVSLVQPLLAPIGGGITAIEVLAALGGDRTPAHDLVRATWKQLADSQWAQALQQGFVDGYAFPRLDLRAAASPVPPPSPGAPLEVSFRLDRRVHDGSAADNAWLQECPDAITQLAWGNAAELAPATALRLGLQTGSVAAIRAGERRLEIPVVVVPGHAEDAVTIALGGGRTAGSPVCVGVGVDAGPLRRSAAPWWDAIDAVEPAGTAELALAQLTLARVEPMAPVEDRPRLYGPSPVHLTAPSQWAMVIDTAACLGCSACVVACQAENNVPVVGEADFRKGRRLHWLRIDRYFPTAADVASATFQPMLCQHCEDAPCELVCPTGATSHSPDGLNEQIYNRCVGTRFCANNCPYGVRRFNWFDYAAARPEAQRAQLNPDVTVRDRGVMEKCTFCVQRIREAGIEARIDGRALRDGEIVPACAQACPTRAITFGDLALEGSAVAALRDDPRAREELGELGTRPRVRYLEGGWPRSR